MKRKSYIAIILVVAVVVMVCMTRQDVPVYEPQVPDQTTNENIELASDISDESTTEETEVVEEDSVPESTKLEEETVVDEPKAEPVTSKKPNPTKVEVVTEPSTQRPSNVTYDGHKPYEVFTSETGTQVYYDEYGRRCAAESLNAKPITPKYDSDCCYECGSETCFRAMSDYRCVTCNKDVPALTCHPKTHYNASH